MKFKKLILTSMLLLNLLCCTNANASILHDATVYDKFVTEHFEFIYPENEEDVVTGIHKKLIENYERILTNLKCTLNRKIVVKLYTSLQTYHEAIGWPDAPSFVAGSVKNGEILSALNTETNVATRIVHEFVHIVTKEINPGEIPAILWEGIAVYEANQSYLKDVLDDIETLPTFDEMFKRNNNYKMMYTVSYAFTEFVIENYGYDKFIEFLKKDYDNNGFNFDPDTRKIYEKWVDSVMTSKNKMLFHIAKEKDWLESQKNEIYGDFSIKKDGFIHCSTLKQLVDVANNNLKNINEKLVVLSIDTNLLKPELKWEKNTKNGIVFPHIYGEINTDCVIDVADFEKDETGIFYMPDKFSKNK